MEGCGEEGHVNQSMVGGLPIVHSRLPVIKEPLFKLWTSAGALRVVGGWAPILPLRGECQNQELFLWRYLKQVKSHSPDITGFLHMDTEQVYTGK